MTDLALTYDPAAGRADLCIADGDLALDHGLASLGLMSLLTDARALPEDLQLSDASGADLRGWWGDALSDRTMGGKLWTLARAKTTRETTRRAEDFARASLAWLVADGIARGVTVTASRKDGDGAGATLGLTATISRPDGARETLLYDLLWRAME